MSPVVKEGRVMFAFPGFSVFPVRWKLSRVSRRQDHCHVKLLCSARNWRRKKARGMESGFEESRAPFSVVGLRRYDSAREKRNSFDLTNRQIRWTPLKRDNFIKRHGSPNWNIKSLHFHTALDRVDRFPFSARLVHSCCPVLYCLSFSLRRSFRYISSSQFKYLHDIYNKMSLSSWRYLSNPVYKIYRFRTSWYRGLFESSKTLRT